MLHLNFLNFFLCVYAYLQNHILNMRNSQLSKIYEATVNLKFQGMFVFVCLFVFWKQIQNFWQKFASTFYKSF